MKTSPNGQVMLHDLCARLCSLQELGEQQGGQVAMRGLKHHSWEALGLTGVVLAQCQASGSSRNSRIYPHTQGPWVHKVPEVPIMFYKVTGFYWILNICMNFNKLTVGKKQKNDQTSGCPEFFSHALELGPTCQGPHSLQDCPICPWELTLEKGQKDLSSISLNLNFSYATLPSSPLTSQYFSFSMFIRKIICFYSQNSLLFFFALFFSFVFFPLVSAWGWFVFFL